MASRQVTVAGVAGVAVVVVVMSQRGAGPGENTADTIGKPAEAGFKAPVALSKSQGHGHMAPSAGFTPTAT
ncbi:uncharacterized protein N7483_002171 [Penicillium malachiteum]|uniref:uncharacterized protein n=1 Tax=Penicillium malachiteum TaxID=1324776 RepID=UPI00254786E2|nr:uncharacterized protein N7483_002171 [Penicillium malachiteum]KAJ5737046.1 hypothetical protein N7483_002171 [Penicillium malachiteum]